MRHVLTTENQSFRIPALRVLPLLAILLIQADLNAATVTWTGNGGNNQWHDGANWSTNEVPGPTDDVVISGKGVLVVHSTGTHEIASLTCSAELTLSGGVLTITGDSQVTGTLTLSTGSPQLVRHGVLTIENFMSWSTGQVDGTGELVIADGAILSLSGTGTKRLSGILRNHGDMQYSGSGLWAGAVSGEPGVFINEPAGTFEKTGLVSTLNAWSPNPDHAFINHGLFTKSGGGTLTMSGVRYENSGVVHVDNSELRLQGGGFNTGTFEIAPGTTLQVTNNFTHEAGSLIDNNGTMDFAGNQTLSGSYIGSGTIRFSSGTTTVTEPLTIAGQLLITGGNIVKDADITLLGTGTWSSGQLDGPEEFTIADGVEFLISTTGQKRLGGTFRNQGFVHYSLSGLQWGAAGTTHGTFINEGEFEWTSVGHLSAWTANPDHVFVNEGTLRKSGAPHVSISGVRFENYGTVEVIGGKLRVLGGGFSEGEVAVGADAHLEVTANFTHQPGSSLGNEGLMQFAGNQTFSSAYTGGGNVQFSSGDVDVAAPMSIAGELLISGGRVIKNADIVVNNSAVWSNGSIDGPEQFIIGADAMLSITTSGQKRLSGTMVNLGEVVYSGSGLFMGAASNIPGVISNIGEFYLTSGGNISAWSFNPGHGFHNAGLLQKTGASVSTVPGVALNNFNSAIIEIQQGTLNPTGGGSNAGLIEIAPGATFNLGTGFTHLATGTLVNNGLLILSGTQDFAAAYSGPGDVQIPSGTTTFNAPAHIHGALTMSGGSNIMKNANITVYGPMTWPSGQLDGPSTLTIANSATLLISTTGQKRLSGTLRIEGEVQYTASAFWFGGNSGLPGLLDIQPGGLFEIQHVTGSFQPWFANPGHTINNAGTMRKVGNGTSTCNGINFNNSGIVELTAGLFSPTTSYQQTAGETRLLGGNINVGTNPLQLLGGKLLGSGTVTGSVINNGSVEPGSSPGLLTVTGNYTHTENGSLHIEVAGTKPIVLHDVLAVGGNAIIDGFLGLTILDHDALLVGDQIELLTAADVDGVFAAASCPGVFVVIYLGDAIIAEVLAAPIPADLNCDGVVDGADLLILLSSWGQCPDSDNCPADLNNSGAVDGADLLLLLSAWGS
jgi:hypothetical protein